MSYVLVYTSRAQRDIKKLEPKIKNSIEKAMLKLKEEPFLYSSKLTNPKIGSYRLRVDNYRVIFDIEGWDIVILRVGHRQDIYRNI
ncbi:MAG: type II toxin-antitoxin system RelE/ParE family toxin [Nitrospirae bacterium]|uniref:type II toxin-antitoxin system RelE family toxin n=1 Tax=Candidatus Magnetobacterium casense TaxID=1455061 RepID=UPI000590A199|nr:type II toxin-antitoxin system RelE/ParE family toxin [Candidatus Magnetobacterium casensis]MBF0336907.1 type II toxin-antitoxin system RelE/ParE family toxin [Nitrospirota bacterium]